MRRKTKVKREIIPDPRYDDILVAKFINHLMKDGKKAVAQKVFYNAFAIIKKSNKEEDPLELFDKAINNVSPFVEVKSRRIGGAHYQVPREVKGERKITLAIRWIIQVCRNKKGKPMSQKLADEFIQASQGAGEAIKKKEDMHRMAEANKAFAHFSW
jgi:small subunit ribosomal protein S7